MKVPAASAAMIGTLIGDVYKRQGPYSINSNILGEYWSEYIVPYWSEYGICKSNMRRGLMPPVSGQFENIWKHSNGAWIRTEIWATMFPCDIEKDVYKRQT